MKEVLQDYAVVVGKESKVLVAVEDIFFPWKVASWRLEGTALVFSADDKELRLADFPKKGVAGVTKHNTVVVVPGSNAPAICVQANNI